MSESLPAGFTSPQRRPVDLQRSGSGPRRVLPPSEHGRKRSMAGTPRSLICQVERRRKTQSAAHGSAIRKQSAGESKQLIRAEREAAPTIRLHYIQSAHRVQRHSAAPPNRCTTQAQNVTLW